MFFFDEAHLLFDRRAAGARGEDRAGRAPDPLEGRRRLSSSPRTRSTFPKRSPASSATGCSTPCAPSPRATRRRSRPPPRPSASIPISTSKPAITELKVGEALVSTLMADGAPSVVAAHADQAAALAPRAGRPRRSARRSSRRSARARASTTRRSTARAAEEVLAQKAADAAATARRSRERRRGSRQAPAPLDRHLGRAVGQGGQAGDRGRGRLGRVDRRRLDHRAEVARQPGKTAGHFGGRLDRDRPRRARSPAASCET